MQLLFNNKIKYLYFAFNWHFILNKGDKHKGDKFCYINACHASFISHKF